MIKRWKVYVGLYKTKKHRFSIDTEVKQRQAWSVDGWTNGDTRHYKHLTDSLAKWVES